MDRRERAGAIKDRKLGGVASIGFDAVTGATRDQRWRDDVTGNAVTRENALQLKPTRAGFVAALGGGAGAPQTADEAKNRRDVGAERVQRRRALTGK